jgi:hypothetical protein
MNDFDMRDLLPSPVNQSFSSYLARKDVVLCGGGPLDAKLKRHCFDKTWAAIRHYHWYEGIPISVLYLDGGYVPGNLPDHVNPAFIWIPTNGLTFDRWSLAGDTQYEVGTYEWADPETTEWLWVDEIKARLGAHPTTGFIAMMHLLRHPIRSLTLTGFTFFRNANGGIMEAPENCKGHSFLREAKAVKILSQTGRLHFDSYLEKIYSEINLEPIN